MSDGMKAVRGDKVSDEPGITRITLRGQEYVVRELSVDEYEECVDAATDKESGLVTFGKLLKMMALRSISPSLAVRKTPLPYPVYRTLEGIVNVTHFTDLPDEAAKDKGGDDEDESGKPEVAAPNA